jgi:Tfp pilus assembly protein PilF
MTAAPKWQVDSRDPWLEDFSLVLKSDAIHSLRRKPEFEAFTGSKAAVFPGLVVSSIAGGALGGILVSSSLWSAWWQVMLWLLALILFAYAARQIVIAKCVPPIGFLVGWCLFFGLLIGAFTMWAAQLSSAAWCYGIAGGLVFILLGITGGLIEPANSKPSEDWFMTSAAMAPIGSCLAAWAYRNVFPEPATIPFSALTGASAALPFLGVTMALHLLAWRPERAIVKLASLYLHNDEFVSEARPLLDTALKSDPESPFLLTRRGLARSLAGDPSGAMHDWELAERLSGRSNRIHIARGWAALRAGDPGAGLKAFQAALVVRKTDRKALVGVGLAQLRLGQDAAALQTLKQVRGKDHDALSLTYLAEAHLRMGEAKLAVEAATTAIEEADSTHGRSWIVRAEAKRALGRIESAAKDYNMALRAADEVGIEDRAIAGLEEIDRPVTDEEPE